MAELPNVPGAPPPEPLLIDGKEAARTLCVSKRLLWSMSVSGEIPSVMIRRRRLYSPSALREWIAENTEGGRT